MVEKEFFFSASSSSSPVLPLLPALHRIFSEDDFAGSRAHPRLSFYRSAGTEKDPLLTALGGGRILLGSADFAQKRFSFAFCFSSHGLEISDDKMEKCTFSW